MQVFTNIVSIGQFKRCKGFHYLPYSNEKEFAAHNYLHPSLKSHLYYRWPFYECILMMGY